MVINRVIDGMILQVVGSFFGGKYIAFFERDYYLGCADREGLK